MTATRTPSIQDLVASLPTSGAPTMSSREIADLCEARHNDVKATIERLFEKGLLRESRKTLRPYSPPTGRPTEVYDLTQRDTYVVVAGYSDEVRAKIIDRWMEMEQDRASRPVADPLAMLNDPAAMRGLLLTYADKVITLEADRAAMAPKVEAHDRIAESFGSVCRRIAAKNLAIPPLVLNRWMRTNGWTYQLPGCKDDLAYQSKMTAGYLEHKVETGERPDGTAWSRTSVRVTPKGMLALAKAFPPVATRVA